MTTRKPARLALVAVCLLPAACATTSYSRGAVAALPAGVKGKGGAHASVEIEGLKLRIETLDYAKKGDAVPQLALRFVFEPSELGYSFDPAQVTLRAADGNEWKPRVTGQGQFLTAPWTCSATGFAVADGRGYQPLAPKSCFDLAFEARLTGERALELELGGVARGRRRIDPVTLTLARRSGRSLDRVYWLEVLLAPLAMYGGG